MPPNLPIDIPLTRPLQTPEPPFYYCKVCHHVAQKMSPGITCPRCNQHHCAFFSWPGSGLIEIWKEAVFCWNSEKAELGTLVAAMYYEAATFDLLYWGACLLKPNLNWPGVATPNQDDKEEAIWKHFDTLRFRKSVDAALKDVFGVDRKTMIDTVLGQEHAKTFQEQCELLAGHRNRFIHRGQRIHVAGAEIHRQFLRENLEFIPHCWTVFSLLWNRFIHNPLFET